jgi:toxin secretion/phage lysis holin
MENLIIALKYLGYIGWLIIVEKLRIQQEMISVLAILMLIDTAFGFARSWVGKSAASRKMKTGLMAKMATIMVPVIIAAVDVAVPVDLSGLTSTAFTVLLIAEAYSIFGHIGYFTSKWKTPGEFDAVSLLIAMLRKKIQDQIERYLWPENK